LSSSEEEELPERGAIDVNAFDVHRLAMGALGMEGVENFGDRGEAL
jgi:hypothetical protein